MRSFVSIVCLFLILGASFDGTQSHPHAADAILPPAKTASKSANTPRARVARTLQKERGLSPGASLRSAGRTKVPSDGVSRTPRPSGPRKLDPYTNITAEDACSSFSSGADVVFLDVREVYEYTAGHIPNAINMPWMSGVLSARHAELPTGVPIIVYCQSGGRSAAAAQFLVDTGHTGIYNMLGGYGVWPPDCPSPPTSVRFWRLYR